MPSDPAGMPVERVTTRFRGGMYVVFVVLRGAELPTDRRQGVPPRRTGHKSTAVRLFLLCRLGPARRVSRGTHSLCSSPLLVLLWGPTVLSRLSLCFSVSAAVVRSTRFCRRACLHAPFGLRWFLLAVVAGRQFAGMNAHRYLAPVMPVSFLLCAHAPPPPPSVYCVSSLPPPRLCPRLQKNKMLLYSGVFFVHN